ncbi:MAG TPA: hypothetical protein VNM37_26105 [Candidatus Dormibacteraeota bacterium]|nr:hypothetical protein [Verrucomicrobiae bacterium]HXJ76360.1 hypothetical protein [Candidatus Dormibacteraeota bacterium]
MTILYTVHGTAENGVDYPELPGSMTIPAGRRAARIVLVPIDDHRPEPIETASFTGVSTFPPLLSGLRRGAFGYCPRDRGL